MSEYIKKLENILEGVENYRFDDMSCAEWEELTTSVLKGAIAREKANKEADELANSIWNRLDSREKGLPEPKFNDNQSLALWAMKNRFKWHSNDIKSGLLEYLTTVSDEVYLSNKEFAEVLQAFATWALDQC